MCCTPDQKIIDIIKSNGGKAFLTSPNHQTGTDRVFEVFKEHLNSEPDIIVNLQGDMPNIDYKVVNSLISYMEDDKCDIGTLASAFRSDIEKKDENKIVVENMLKNNQFDRATDFSDQKKKPLPSYWNLCFTRALLVCKFEKIK